MPTRYIVQFSNRKLKLKLKLRGDALCKNLKIECQYYHYQSFVNSNIVNSINDYVVLTIISPFSFSFLFVWKICVRQGVNSIELTVRKYWS